MRKPRISNDCCEYRERLAREKRERRKVKKPGKTRKNVTECCGKSARIEQAPETADPESKQKRIGCYGLKQKSKRIKKPQKLLVDIDQIFLRIKPSYDDREKYLNVKHILCVLESEDALKLIKLREIRKQEEKSKECNESKNESGDARSGKEEAEDGGPERQQSETKEKDEQQKNKYTAKERKSKQNALDSKNGRKDKTDKKKFSIQKDKIECTSICSLDSVIDLTEFALTREDINKIKKTTEEADAQKEDQENDANKSDEATEL